MLEMMSYKDPVAAAARKYKPIQSAVPGTTLGPIEIDAFLGGGVSWDSLLLWICALGSTAGLLVDLSKLGPIRWDT